MVSIQFDGATQSSSRKATISALPFFQPIFLDVPGPKSVSESSITSIDCGATVCSLNDFKHLDNTSGLEMLESPRRH